MKGFLVKRLWALLSVASLSLSLSACGSDDAKDNNATPSASSSTTETVSAEECMNSVNVTSDGMPKVNTKGETPVIDFTGATQPEDVRLSLIEEGKGEKSSGDGSVKVNYVGYVWGSTKAFDSSFARGTEATFSLTNVIPGFTCAFNNRSVGDKFIVSIPARYGYGPSGGNESAGIGEKDTIVFYVELLGIIDSDAVGEKSAQRVTQDNDLPVTITGGIGEVVTDVTVKEGQTEPKETKVIVIAKGSGEPLKDGDTALISIFATSWDGTQKYSTYKTGDENVAKNVGVQSIPVGSAGVEGLVDVPRGSRVLLLDPAREADEASGQTASPASANVLDIVE